MDEIERAGYAPPKPKKHIHIEALDETEFKNDLDHGVKEALMVLRSIAVAGSKEDNQLKAATTILDYALRLNGELNGDAPKLGDGGTRTTQIIFANSPEVRDQLRQAAAQVTQIVAETE